MSAAAVYAWPDSAISEEAQQTACHDSSVVVARRFWDLEDAFFASRAANWDGYGASPVAVETFERARWFLAAIPEAWPSPEVAPEPDGALAFEWARGRRWVFSVSVDPGGRLSYAGLFGVSRTHGVESFAGTIPDAIVGNLARLYASDAAEADK